MDNFWDIVEQVKHNISQTGSSSDILSVDWQWSFANVYDLGVEIYNWTSISIFLINAIFWTFHFAEIVDILVLINLSEWDTLS